jgi:hypothetical protein
MGTRAPGRGVRGEHRSAARGELPLRPGESFLCVQGRALLLRPGTIAFCRLTLGARGAPGLDRVRFSPVGVKTSVLPADQVDSGVGTALWRAKISAWGALIRSSRKSTGFGMRPSLCTPRP